MSDARTLHHIVVLSADICGSTRLYEVYGNDVARRDVALCLALLCEVAEQHGGEVVETVGDEIVCSFARPGQVVDVGREMHQALRAASAAGRFRSGPLRVKIAWHYGLAEWRDGKLVGATPCVQQQVIGLARAEEVLLSGAALDALPAALRAQAQLLDTLTSVADGSALPVYRLPWEDDADATRFRPAPSPPAPSQRLELCHGERRLTLDAAHPRCTIGRTEENDIATASRFTSRLHAEISLRQGRFYLADNSSNGTLVIPREGERELLHHEQGVLHGEGVLVCGDVAGEDTAARVAYRCD